MSQEFTLTQNDDYVAVKGNFVGESIRILVLNGSIFDDAKLKIFVGELYNEEFDFNEKVVKEETEITVPTGFHYNSYTKDDVPLYAILKLTNAGLNTSIKISIGTSTKTNIKSSIQ